MTNVFLCNVPDEFREDYEIAIKNNLWGVKNSDNYKNKRDSVSVNDILILENKFMGAIIGKITGKIDDLNTNIWLVREGDNYPYRVKLDIIYKYDSNDINDILIKCLKDNWGSQYKNMQALGRGLSGTNGQFRKLKPEEYCCIFNEIKSKRGENIIENIKNAGINNIKCDNNSNKMVTQDKEDIKWWIEKTRKSTHKIDYAINFNSSLGIALWSPQTSKSGANIYENMKKVKVNDRVIHLVMDENNSFWGVSLVNDGYKDFTIPPGSWNPEGAREGYFVTLKDFSSLNPPIKWEVLVSKYKDELIRIYEKYNNIFYDKNLDLNQGAYLTEAPKEFVDLLNKEYFLISQTSLPHYNESEETNVEGKKMEKNKEINNLPKNIILHGPVGTGKTYFANIIAKKIVHNEIHSLGDIEKIINSSSESIDLDKEDQKSEESKDDEERIVNVTFHKSYSYEDFIIGIKAETKDGQISYDVKPGRFKQLCDKASVNKNENYVLIIDEINRGDMSRIFGELITLIEEDKRGEKNKITLPYNKENSDEPEELVVPENLYIIGTMNDSDKSISLVDIALRRRFTFIYVGFNENVLREWLKEVNDQEENVIKFIKEINERISAYKGSLDFQIGHAFFRNLKEYNGKEKEKEIVNIFKYKIFPLLEEYFYNDMDFLVEKILNNKFYEKLPKNNNDESYYYFMIKNGAFESFNNFLNELINNKEKNESTSIEKENS